MYIFCELSHTRTLSEISTPHTARTSLPIATRGNRARFRCGIFLSIRYFLSSFVPPPNFVNMSPLLTKRTTACDGILFLSTVSAPSIGVSLTTMQPYGVCIFPGTNGTQNSLSVSFSSRLISLNVPLPVAELLLLVRSSVMYV